MKKLSLVLLSLMALTGCNFEPGALVGEQSNDRNDSGYYRNGVYYSGNACEDRTLRRNSTAANDVTCTPPDEIDGILIEAKEIFPSKLRLILRGANLILGTNDLTFRAVGKSREAKGECKDVTTPADPANYKVYECKVLTSDKSDFSKYVVQSMSLKNSCGSQSYYYADKLPECSDYLRVDEWEEGRVWVGNELLPVIRPN